jgi:hypothetical protein
MPRIRKHACPRHRAGRKARLRFNHLTPAKRRRTSPRLPTRTPMFYGHKVSHAGARPNPKTHRSRGCRRWSPILGCARPKSPLLALKRGEVRLLYTRPDRIGMGAGTQLIDAAKASTRTVVLSGKRACTTFLRSTRLSSDPLY